MDHEYVQSQNLAERYVLGRLSEEEQVRFEDHFMACEVCLEEVEAVQDLAPALRAEAARSAAVAVESVARDVEMRAGLGALLAAVLRRPAGRALAAGLAVAVLVPLLWLGFENRQLRSEAQRADGAVVSTPTAVLVPTRGGSDFSGPSISPGPDHDRFTLLVEVEPDPRVASYEAEVRGADGAPVWQGKELVASDGRLALTFHTGLLPPGEYELHLTARGTASGREAAGIFPFRVRRADADDS